MYSLSQVDPDFLIKKLDFDEKTIIFILEKYNDKYWKKSKKSNFWLVKKSYITQIKKRHGFDKHIQELVINPSEQQNLISSKENYNELKKSRNYFSYKDKLPNLELIKTSKSLPDLIDKILKEKPNNEFNCHDILFSLYGDLIYRWSKEQYKQYYNTIQSGLTNTVNHSDSNWHRVRAGYYKYNTKHIKK